MTSTTNYDLNMPEQDDFYNVDDINANMETIDAVMYEFEQNVSGLGEKIGETSDTGGSGTEGTVMAKLNALMAGGSAIKSIQRGYVNMDSVDNKTVTIKAVNTSKSMILLNGNGSGKYISTGKVYLEENFGVFVLAFTSTSFTLKQASGYTEGIYNFLGNVSWQIIEFN